MIINGKLLLEKQPIKDMLNTKVSAHGVSHGLSEAGYDIRIAESVRFSRHKTPPFDFSVELFFPALPKRISNKLGTFTLASTIEQFQMPDDLVGIVHDKSTWARKGLSVFNTVIEPGWNGFLTLELVYNGLDDLFIPAGAGIAQVIFHQTAEQSHYTGKYQNQEAGPQSARKSL